MSNNFKEFYKVDNSAVETAYNKHIGLKNNEEYEKWADDTAVALIEYFENKYKGVVLEIPELREKSAKSVLGKIKNLQIERISKLYAVDTITDREKQEFIELISERIDEDPSLDKENLLKEIDKLIYSDEIDIESFEKNFLVDGLSKSTKTALLRMLVGKIEKAEYPNKKVDLVSLNEKYGEKAVKITGIPEKNLVKYASLVDLKKNERKFNRLKNENEYLKVNDLRGMKIVVSDVPDDLETDNVKIKELIEKRNNAITGVEKRQYSHQIIVEMGLEFFKDLEENEELLKRLNMQVIPGSNKHKKKTNGYEADHIKFMNSKEPEYTLEMQLKSGYVENKTMGTGSASHENRPGKERIIPESENDDELRKEYEYICPKYKTLREIDGKKQWVKLTERQNVLVHFQGKLKPGSDDYEKIFKLFPDNNDGKDASNRD